MRTPSIIMILLLATACAQEETPPGKNITLTFATVEEGKAIITRRDDYIKSLSPFDRAAKMKTDKDVTEKEHLEFAAKHVLAWSDTEKQQVSSAFQGARTALEALSLPLPEKVFIVQTTGDEEGGAAYTRADAIFFPQPLLTRYNEEQLRKLMVHEFFHIMTRANPDLREEFYAAIGFEKCDELALPSGLKSRKISNPDAPKNDHCIQVTIDNVKHWVVPIIFSHAEKYDVAQGGTFFDYLQFRLLVVERDEGTTAVKPVYDGEEPKLLDLDQVSGFFEQVGRNTEYIIHPEEILADNFSLLVMGESDLPSPEIIEKMDAILKK